MFRRELGMVERIVGVSAVTEAYFSVRSGRIFERIADRVAAALLCSRGLLVWFARSMSGSESSEGVAVS